MNNDKEKLYETLGELIYAIAWADGVIQEEEEFVLNSILETHPWASTIKWSFDYEKNKQHTVEETYKKVIDYCKNYGPTEEYAEFIDLMTRVASANEGIAEKEQEIITSFSKDLTERFKRDIEKLG